MSTSPQMPPCPYDADDQVAYAYGEMESELAAAFLTHLEYCATCRGEVDQLTAFAGLTQRIARQPAPEVDWQEPAPAMKPQRPAWTGWLMWTGATAAVAAAVLLMLLSLPMGPAPVGPQPAAPAVAPSAPVVADIQAPVAPAPEAPAAIQRVAISGTLELHPAAGGATRTASGPVELKAGDRLSTGATATAAWRSADGTQLELTGKSQIALVETAQSVKGERWRLERGAIVCQVAPRDIRRPFAVVAGPGQVVVKGTHFSVRLDGPDELVVTVSEGVVAVKPVGAAATTDVRAGQQARLVRGQPVVLDEPDSQARDLLGMAPAKPARRAAKAPAKRPAKVATTRPEPVPVAPPAPEPAPTGPGLDAADLAAELTADANWVFDGIRRDMRAGKYKDGLRKLDNYLGDPLGPARDEATYLKALCQEQLGQIRAAQRTYRLYLERWPTGPRAKAAQAGKLRTH